MKYHGQCSDHSTHPGGCSDRLGDGTLVADGMEEATQGKYSEMPHCHFFFRVSQNIQQTSQNKRWNVFHVIQLNSEKQLKK